ncbi:MAG: extracellular solute-binding protein [Defluviitaleaceae bacterium]|nr:extracellular solute-binding protein [Defluviitaleaceae bacterium]
MKKILVLVAVLLLAVVVFAACDRGGDGGETPPVATPTPEAAPPADQGAQETPPEVEDVPTERVSFTIRPTHDAVVPGIDDPIFHLIQDSLNVEINPINIEDDQIMAVMAAAGDLPDVFWLNTFMHDNFYNWIDQGILRSIPRDMIAQHPEVNRRVNASMEIDIVSQVRGGDVWFLPRPFDINPLLTASPMRLWYRADWARDLGLDTPQTTDDLWNMLEAFQNEQPGGNGPVFAMTAPGNWTLTAMIAMFSGHDMDGWSYYEGQWIPNFANPAQLVGLQWLRDAYQAGFIDPEFSITGWMPALEALADGTVGFVPRNGQDPFWVMRTNRFVRDIMGEGYTELDAFQTGTLGIMPPLVAPGNDRAYWPPLMNSDGWVVSSRVDDVTLDAILRFFEFGMQPENVIIGRHGIEGETYEIIDGRIVRMIDPESETEAPFNVTVKWPGTALLNQLTWDSNTFWDFNEPETMIGHNVFREESLRINEPYNAAGIDEGEGVVLRIARLPAFLDMRDFVDPLNDFVLMMRGTRPLEDMWAEAMDEWNALGLQRAIDEATAFMASR